MPCIGLIDSGVYAVHSLVQPSSNVTNHLLPNVRNAFADVGQAFAYRTKAMS
jgi:hypothetical protein